MKNDETMHPPMPLFRIDEKALKSVSDDEIKASIAAMHECGVLRTPFDDFAIEVRNAHDLLRQAFTLDAEEEEAINNVPDVVYTIRYQIKDGDYAYFRALTKIKYSNNKEVIAMPPMMREDDYELVQVIERRVLQILLILLATKNVDKKIRENDIKSKNHQAREDAKKRFTTTTVIKIGTITETLEGHGVSGREMRPHLRRGHVRNQRYGEGKSEIKKVFIAPVFVNADKGWVSVDKNYKIVA